MQDHKREKLADESEIIAGIARIEQFPERIEQFHIAAFAEFQRIHSSQQQQKRRFPLLVHQIQRPAGILDFRGERIRRIRERNEGIGLIHRLDFRGS